ncbi:MAG: hypothetical protein ABRQ37_22910 [Candidatus Eremiobacterota bacterium]
MIKGPSIDKAPVSKQTIIEHMGICPVLPDFLRSFQNRFIYVNIFVEISFREAKEICKYEKM